MAAVLLCSVLPMNVFSAEGALFADDFSSSELSGWNSKDAGTVENGAYTLKANRANSATKVGEVEKVAVSADVAVSVATQDNGFKSGMAAYVTAGGNESLTQGYDFGIGVTKKGITYVRLFKRNPAGENEILYQNSKGITGLGTIEQNKSYTVKLIVAQDNLLMCYVNDCLVAQVTDKTFTEGYVGLRAIGGQATFDNFKVQDVPNKKVESISVVNCQNTISRSGKLFFEIAVQHNSVYGEAILNQDSDGVTVAGLDGTAGTKEVTIAYGGKSVKTTVNVVEKYTPKVLFQEEFSSDLSAWDTKAFKNNDYNFTYQFLVENGYVISAEPNLNGADIAYNASITLKQEEMADFREYSVSTEATIMKDATTPTERKANAALQFAKNGNNENYELRLRSDGQLTVRCNGTAIYATTAEEVLGKNIAMGTTATLRADVYADYYAVYLNDVLITRITAGVDSTTPHVCLITYAGTVRYDNVIVKEIETKGDYAISSIACYNIISGKKVTTYTGNTINTEELYLLVTYVDGDTRMVKIREGMMSAYSKTENVVQKLTVSYKGKKTTLNFTWIPYMFYDNFENGAYKSEWSFRNTNGQNGSVENDRYTATYQDVNNTDNGTLSATVTTGTEWTDYAVSADVYLDMKRNANGKNPGVGLIVRNDAVTGSCYEFRLTTDGTAVIGHLYRKVNGVAELIATYSQALLVKVSNSGKSLMKGEMYNIKLEVRENTINTYIDGGLIASYIDKSEQAILKGAPGFLFVSFTGSVDNYKVESRSGATPAKIELANVTTGEIVKDIDVIKGNTIDLWDYQLNVHYHDGIMDNVLLTSEMMTEFDCMEVGTQTVTINYKSQKVSFKLKVSERPEYVDDFIKQLKAFDKEVTEKNKEAFIALKDYHDSLTPWEVSQLKEKLVKKYEKLLESYDRGLATEIADSDLLLMETFDQGNLDNWSDQAVEINATEWKEVNGVAYQVAVPYNKLYNTGWIFPEIYGELTGISADCMMLSEGEHLGIAFNMSDVGSYDARIVNTSKDAETGETIYTLRLYRKVGKTRTTIASADLRDYDIELTTGEWFNLRLTLDGTTLKAYVNGKPILSSEETNPLFATGECGLLNAQGDGLFDNVMVYGTELERIESAAKIEPTTYEDNFEDEATNASPSHWQENYVASKNTDNWKVYNSDGKVYGTKASGETATWLHVFDNNPQMSFRFKADNLSKTSKLGIISRRSPDTAFVNIGYDHAQKKWYVESQESQYEGAVITYAEETFAMKKGTWYKAELVEDGAAVSLSIDGKVVVSSSKVGRTGWGRLGFFTKDASMMVDDIKCTFASGDVPQDGMISYVVIPDVYAGYMEVQSPDNGKTLIGIAQSKRMLSTDGGETWKDITKENVYPEIKSEGYVSLNKLSNGLYMKISAANDYGVYTSKDMVTWTRVGQVLPTEMQTENGLDITLHTVNSATEYTMKNGTSRIFVPVVFRRYTIEGTSMGHYTRVYYSDDFGVTWQASETSTKEILPGYQEDVSSTWAESKVIQCSDGTLRLYYSRNYLGCMQYTVSEDEGKTWSGFYQMPELQCAMTSFAVSQDTDGTYYMAWVNNKVNYLGNQDPRCRLSLAQSEDGKNWTFLMDCERMTETMSAENGKELYQILDPSIYITDEHLFITFGRSETEQNETTGHQAQRTYLIRVEKDKLVEREWNASNIADMTYPAKVEFAESPQTKFGVGDFFQYSGTLKLTGLDGVERTASIASSCTVMNEPNTFKLGKETVQMYFKNGYNLSYEIEVVPNYNIKWNITGNGKIVNQATKIMEGATKEFETAPEEGWRLKSVSVDGKKVKISKQNFFEISDVKADCAVEVVFAEKTVLDYWWIFAIVILNVVGIGTGIVLYRKKKGGQE